MLLPLDGPPGFSIWLGSNPAFLEPGKSQDLRPGLHFPPFVFRKSWCQDGNQKYGPLDNIHGIKPNNFNSIIRKKTWRHLEYLQIISRNGDDPIYDLFHLQAIGALSFCHSSPDSAWTISSHIHYILLNDCHAPWSSLCHLSPRCPWTTAWVKSHATNDRTTLCQRDKSQGTQTIRKPWTFPLVSSHTDAIFGQVYPTRFCTFNLSFKSVIFFFRLAACLLHFPSSPPILWS